jgi:hypothetical protein
MSSRKSQTSFLEERLEIGKGSDTVYVSDYPLWAIKKHNFKGAKFRVEVGDRFSRSRILKDGDTPREGAAVQEVPESLRKPFTDDIDAALRDLAGVATYNLSPLIGDRKSILDAVRPALVHPFSKETAIIDVNDPIELNQYFLVKTACRISQSKWVPRLNPEAPRFMHIDIGLRNDALGIGMAHNSGLRQIEQFDPLQGENTLVTMPTTVVDLMLQVRAHPGGEVDLPKIYNFVIWLRKIYNIIRCTFDGFNSAHIIQLLNKAKIEAGQLSVDRGESPYLALRGMYSDRSILTYHYEPYITEILDLQRDPSKQKVDHPTKNSKGGRGSKDVADGVCGAVWQCLTDERAKVNLPLLTSMLDPLGGLARGSQIVDPGISTSSIPESKVIIPGNTTWSDLRKLGKS